MNWQPGYQRRPPIMVADELLIAADLIRANLSDLARLHGQIVRRGLAPAGWSAEYMDTLLEMRCALQLLRQQIDAYWPAQAARPETREQEVERLS